MEYRDVMVGFYIKKAFFDGWDNLYLLAGLNAVYLAILILFMALPLVLGLPGWLVLIAGIAGVIALSWWDMVVAEGMYRIASARSYHFGESWALLKKSLKMGLMLAAMRLLMLVAVLVAIPFYFSRGGMWGAFAGGIMFWFMILALLVVQYVPSMWAHDGGSAREVLKKSLYLFADNPGFSLFLLVWRGITLVFSLLTMLIAPGLAGVSLASAAAVRLRMKKYAWMKGKNPEERKHVPWDDLLKEEKELVGKRTLKGMIFPWKE